VILNISCTALMNPQVQPVLLMDAKNRIYTTSCSGLAETIGTCHVKAKHTCLSGYQVLDEIIDSSGLHRQLRFQCKD
jgi:hypothetical protein